MSWSPFGIHVLRCLNSMASVGLDWFLVKIKEFLLTAKIETSFSGFSEIGRYHNASYSHLSTRITRSKVCDITYYWRSPLFTSDRALKCGPREVQCWNLSTAPRLFLKSECAYLALCRAAITASMLQANHFSLINVFFISLRTALVNLGRFNVTLTLKFANAAMEI